MPIRAEKGYIASAPSANEEVTLFTSKGLQPLRAWDICGPKHTLSPHPLRIEELPPPSYAPSASISHISSALTAQDAEDVEPAEAAYDPADDIVMEGEKQASHTGEKLGGNRHRQSSGDTSSFLEHTRPAFSSAQALSIQGPSLFGTTFRSVECQPHTRVSNCPTKGLSKCYVEKVYDEDLRCFCFELWGSGLSMSTPAAASDGRGSFIVRGASLRKGEALNLRSSYLLVLFKYLGQPFTCELSIKDDQSVTRRIKFCSHDPRAKSSQFCHVARLNFDSCGPDVPEVPEVPETQGSWPDKEDKTLDPHISSPLTLDASFGSSGSTNDSTAPCSLSSTLSHSLSNTLSTALSPLAASTQAVPLPTDDFRLTRGGHHIGEDGVEEDVSKVDQDQEKKRPVTPPMTPSISSPITPKAISTAPRGLVHGQKQKFVTRPATEAAPGPACSQCTSHVSQVCESDWHVLCVRLKDCVKRAFGKSFASLSSIELTSSVRIKAITVTDEDPVAYATLGSHLKADQKKMEEAEEDLLKKLKINFWPNKTPLHIFDFPPRQTDRSVSGGRGTDGKTAKLNGVGASSSSNDGINSDGPHSLSVSAQSGNACAADGASEMVSRDGVDGESVCEGCCFQGPMCDPCTIAAESWTFPPPSTSVTPIPSPRSEQKFVGGKFTFQSEQSPPATTTTTSSSSAFASNSLYSALQSSASPKGGLGLGLRKEHETSGHEASGPFASLNAAWQRNSGTPPTPDSSPVQPKRSKGVSKSHACHSACTTSDSPSNRPSATTASNPSLSLSSSFEGSLTTRSAETSISASNPISKSNSKSTLDSNINNDGSTSTVSNLSRALTQPAVRGRFSTFLTPGSWHQRSFGRLLECEQDESGARKGSPLPDSPRHPSAHTDGAAPAAGSGSLGGGHLPTIAALDLAEPLPASIWHSASSDCIRYHSFSPNRGRTRFDDGDDNFQVIPCPNGREFRPMLPTLLEHPEIDLLPTGLDQTVRTDTDEACVADENVADVMSVSVNADRAERSGGNDGNHKAEEFKSAERKEEQQEKKGDGEEKEENEADEGEEKEDEDLSDTVDDELGARENGVDAGIDGVDGADGVAGDGENDADDGSRTSDAFTSTSLSSRFKASRLLHKAKFKLLERYSRNASTKRLCASTPNSPAPSFREIIELSNDPSPRRHQQSHSQASYSLQNVGTATDALGFL